MGEGFFSMFKAKPEKAEAEPADPTLADVPETVEEAEAQEAAIQAARAKAEASQAVAESTEQAARAAHEAAELQELDEQHASVLAAVQRQVNPAENAANDLTKQTIESDELTRPVTSDEEQAQSQKQAGDNVHKFPKVG